MNNRRNGFRVPARLLVNQFSDDELRVCLSCNIGTEGLYLYSSPQPLRNVVSLEFQLPGERESIWAKGEVRYQERCGTYQGCGISFSAMANRHWDLISDWVIAARLAQLRAAMRRPLPSLRRRLAA